MLNVGDKVKYIGKKFASELGNKIGEINSKISGSDNVYVVDFGEDNGYVMQEGRHIQKRNVFGSEALSSPIRYKKSED